MSHNFVCWRCGASLAALTLPFTRTDECKNCKAAVHACKLCEFYSIAVAKHCREPIAEEVTDKERVNFCDYFKPRANAYSDRQQVEGNQARAQLDALFGAGKKADSAAAAAKPSDAELAKAKLDELFGKK